MAGLAASRLEQLERVRRRLLDKHLLTAADDAVSALLPGTGRMLLWRKTDQNPRELPLAEQSGIAALHGHAYRLRGDIGAIASASTATSAELWRRYVRVPIVFDEQARHIGEAWTGVPAGQLPAALAGGANAGVVDARFLVLGVTPNRMVFNTELFEKSAHAYLLARGESPERRTYLVPWWVRLIAGRRLRRDQQNAARRHAAGNEAEELVAY